MATLLTQKIWRKTLTSITASIRPDTPDDALVQMIHSGVTILRINLSWFKEKYKQQWILKIAKISSIASDEKLVLGIMIDTRGPEFRVAGMGPNATTVRKEKTGYEYKAGADVLLTLDPSVECCDENRIAVNAPRTRFGELGNRVVFCDGDYEANIISSKSEGVSIKIRAERPICVWEGAKVNFPGTVVTAKALSDEDQSAIRFFVDEAGRDLDRRVNFMFAQSFIKSVEDVNRLRHFLEDTWNWVDPIIIAKLETLETSREKNLRRIIKASTAIMIARGDLANETSRQEVPKLQRQIIKAAKEFNKPVLLATQVYASMSDAENINCQRPEAEDVRSALEWGVDGFVLTGETTSDERTERTKDPQKVVQALADQIRKDESDLIESGYYTPFGRRAQKQHYKDMRKRMRDPGLPLKEQRWLGTTDFAIAAVFRANAYRAIGLFPFTKGGATVREMNRFYPETEVYALANEPDAAQRLLLYRCTHPILVDFTGDDMGEFKVDDFKKLVRQIINDLRLRERKPNAKYAIGTMAHPLLKAGGTDILMRIRIDEVEEED